jgi:SSS family solute:Na+ symporter
VPAIFGAPIWLGFVWRRVTKWAVIGQVTICLVIYALIPNLFQGLDSVARNPRFLAETAPRTVVVRTAATVEDVAAGRAASVGRSFERTHVLPPVGVYFDRVARENPSDPESPRIGLGRFNAEVWVVGWFGVDFTNWSRAQLLATRFFFDALFPFVLLFALSFVTPRAPSQALDRFFARLHTPVQATPETDSAAVAAACANPGQYERDKLFPGSQWEIMKPARSDYIGFFGTWALVGVVILLLWLMVTVR